MVARPNEGWVIFTDVPEVPLGQSKEKSESLRHTIIKEDLARAISGGDREMLTKEEPVLVQEAIEYLLISHLDSSGTVRKDERKVSSADIRLANLFDHLLELVRENPNRFASQPSENDALLDEERTLNPLYFDEYNLALFDLLHEIYGTDSRFLNFCQETIPHWGIVKESRFYEIYKNRPWWRDVFLYELE